MKAVILAGGLGTRLYPLTIATNKALLPIGKSVIILESIKKLSSNGIKDILIITNKESIEQFSKLLGDGSKYDCNIFFKIQENPDGIASGLLLAEKFTNNEKFIFLLSDNFFEDDFKEYISIFKASNKNFICLKESENPEFFGVALIEENNLIKIIEKPKEFFSKMCVTGLYFYTEDIYTYIRKIKKSDRGEYEITDLNNLLIENRLLDYFILNGKWSDIGTIDEYIKINYLYGKSKC